MPNKYSNFKILGFPNKLESMRHGRVTAPVYVRIKPINRCTMACHWCAYSDGTKRSKDRPEQHLQTHMHETMSESDVIPLPKMLEILADLQHMGVKAVTYSGGGEPLMYPKIASVMRQTLEHKLDLSVITNGQLLNDDRAEVLTEAKWVRVSVDYTNAQQLVQSRNIPEAWFDTIVANIRKFAAKKKNTCDLELNFIVTRENHADLVPFAAMMKDCGVQNIRFSPVYVENFMAYHAPIADRVEAQLQEAQAMCYGNFTINSTYDLHSPSKGPHRAFSRCWIMQLVPVIGADQRVYFCHNVAYSSHGCLGSIRDRTFYDLWFSREAEEKFKTFNPCGVCTHECTGDAKNRVISDILDTHQDNFV